MIHVHCVRWGDKYDISYVNRLYSMVKRNMTMDFKFYCQTDDTRGMNVEIEHLPFLEDLPNSTPQQMWDSGEYSRGLPRLWDRPKLNYWKPNGWGIKGTKMYFDLDLIIQKNLTPLIEDWEQQDKPMIGRSWWHNMDDEAKPLWLKNHGARVNGGVYIWNDKQGKPIWKHISKEGNAEKAYFVFTGGTDNYLTEIHMDEFNFVSPDHFYSFNRGCAWPDDIHSYKHRPDKTICVFNTDVGNHLHFELHEAAKGWKWVSGYWW